MAKAEKLLAGRLQPGGLYDPVNMPLLHHINQALRAHTLFHIDVDYMVKDDGVVIVDEFTGRLMPGRRWSDGLHQAVEAKEQTQSSGSQDRAREPDARDGHLPELLPQVRQALRHDRHGRHRSRRVREDLQARRDGHPDQPRAEAGRGAGHRLPHRAREVRSDRHRHPREAEGRAAGPGRHGLDREVGAALEAAEAARHQARRPEREVSRPGSGDRRPGRTQGDGDHRDQHGRPRHRHPARRQPRIHGPAADARRRDRRAAAEVRGEVRRRRRVRLLLPHRQFLSRAARGLRADLQRAQGADRRRARRGRGHRRAAHHRAPNATRRAASTTSCAAAPAVRATRARRASTCRSKTT